MARNVMGLKPTLLFPNRVVLIDTGERRYPRQGESYLFADPESGEVDGPHQCYDGDGSDEDSWYGPADSYAILRREER